MTKEELETWLIAHIATRLKVPKESVDPVRPLEEYGFDSLEAVALTGEIELLLDRQIDPTIIWDYPSVRAVAAYLAQEPSTAQPADG